MASKLLKDLAAEMAAHAAMLGPVIEGLEDYVRLNITPESKAAVQQKLKVAQTRVELMTAAADALNKLDDQGYPDFDPTQVTEAVLADLKNQQDTITAALAKFTAIEEAKTAEIIAGQATDKQP